jgi:hypothetical protein
VQLFLAAAPPLWELASPAQLLRSKLFSRFVRTQARRASMSQKGRFHIIS